jgi:hypothetical protein
MNHNLYTRGKERMPSYLFVSTGTAPLHPAYNNPLAPKINPSEYRKYEKIQEQVQKKKAATPPISPTEAPILLFQPIQAKPNKAVQASMPGQPGVSYQSLHQRYNK